MKTKNTKSGAYKLDPSSQTEDEMNQSIADIAGVAGNEIPDFVNDLQAMGSIMPEGAHWVMSCGYTDDGNKVYSACISNDPRAFDKEDIRDARSPTLALAMAWEHFMMKNNLTNTGKVLM